MHSNQLQLNPAKTDILWSATSHHFHQLQQSSLRVGTDYILPARHSRSQNLHWRRRLNANSCHKDSVGLFCGAVLTTEHPSVSIEARSPVAGVVTCFVSTGLQQLDRGRHPSTSSSAAPISDECSCLADFSIVEIQPRHSGSSSTPLAEGSRTVWLQTRRPYIQMPAWVGTAIPHRRTMPTSWSWGSTATALGLVFITDCPPNSTLHCRQSSLPGRHCSCLEQSATVRHFCAFSSRLFTSAENHFFSVSFPEQFWRYSACEVTSSLLGTLIVHLNYLYYSSKWWRKHCSLLDLRSCGNPQ